jgi:primosomal replication protein N
MKHTSNFSVLFFIFCLINNHAVQSNFLFLYYILLFSPSSTSVLSFLLDYTTVMKESQVKTLQIFYQLIVQIGLC